MSRVDTRTPAANWRSDDTTPTGRAPGGERKPRAPERHTAETGVMRGLSELGAAHGEHGGANAAGARGLARAQRPLVVKSKTVSGSAGELGRPAASAPANAGEQGRAQAMLAHAQMLANVTFPPECMEYVMGKGDPPDALMRAAGKDRPQCAGIRSPIERAKLMIDAVHAHVTADYEETESAERVQTWLATHDVRDGSVTVPDTESPRWTRPPVLRTPDGGHVMQTDHLLNWPSGALSALSDKAGREVQSYRTFWKSLGCENGAQVKRFIRDHFDHQPIGRDTPLPGDLQALGAASPRAAEALRRLQAAGSAEYQTCTHLPEPVRASIDDMAARAGVSATQMLREQPPRAPHDPRLAADGAPAQHLFEAFATHLSSVVVAGAPAQDAALHDAAAVVNGDLAARGDAYQRLADYYEAAQHGDTSAASPSAVPAGAGPWGSEAAAQRA